MATRMVPSGLRPWSALDLAFALDVEPCWLAYVVSDKATDFWGRERGLIQ